MTTISTDLAPVDQPVNLSINDIQNLLIIVDLATQRGAFRGAELGQIGQVFDRVNAFVQSALPPPQDGQPPSMPPVPGAGSIPPIIQPMAQPVPQPITPMAPPFTPKAGAQ